MAVESLFRRKRGGSTSTETVITCTGDLTDPNFKRKFRSILRELRGFVCKGSEERLRVRKMEPWNSVRVTFSIGVEAAERLRVLAEQGGEALARLGILSVQLPSGQVISVRVSTPSTPPNVVAPAASSIPPLVPPAAAPIGVGIQAQQQQQQQQVAQAQQTVGLPRFPFTSMAQASAIVSREAKSCLTQSLHPHVYHEARIDPLSSPLLVNLLQTDQVVGSNNSPGAAGRPTAFTRPAPSGSYTTSVGGKAPPPYCQPASSSSLASSSSSSSSSVLGATGGLVSPPTGLLAPPQQRHAPGGGLVSPLHHHQQQLQQQQHHHQLQQQQQQQQQQQHHLNHNHNHQHHQISSINSMPSHQSHQEPSPSCSTMSNDSSALPPSSAAPNNNSGTSSSRDGKTVQYLINPLTGVLEPMVSSESESETEGGPTQEALGLSRESSSPPLAEPPPPPLPPPPAPTPVVKTEPLPSPLPTAMRSNTLVPTPATPLIPVVSLQRHPITINSQNQLPIVSIKPEPEDDSRLVKKEDVVVTPVATQPVVALAPVQTVPPPVVTQPEAEPVDEERPKGEEKIKLRLKLEKTESSFNQYKATETGGSVGLSSEPRVPPLHISLRGRPAVVSRKEKRKREDSGSPREKEREPLSQGTYEGTCQFPSEAEVASILRSMPTGGKLLNTSVASAVTTSGSSTTTARRKRDKKKIYPRSVPRVEEKLKKGGGSLLKSVVKSAAKEVRMMTAQRASKPLQNKKPASPVLNNQTGSVMSGKPCSTTELDHKSGTEAVNGSSPSSAGSGKFKEIGGPGSGSSSSSSGGSTGSTGDDSGIESMDALSEKSPNQSTSPLRKEDLPKKKEKEVEEVVPIRLTPALYTYSNPERQREETPSPDHGEEERFGGKSLLEQLLIDIPNGDATERRPNNMRRSPEVSPTLPNSGKRGRRPSESSSSDPPTPRPNKRKCSENASELIKACIDDGKRDAPIPTVEPQDFSDDEAKRKEEEEARLRLTEEKPAIRTTFNTRRSVRQSEIREQRPTRKAATQPKKEEIVPAINSTCKRRRNSKDK